LLNSVNFQFYGEDGGSQPGWFFFTDYMKLDNRKRKFYVQSKLYCIRKSRAHPDEVCGKSVLEIGAYDVNGSLRQTIEKMEPASYKGVDLFSGPGVDLICSITDLVRDLGAGICDVVIATEVLEHVKDWRKAVSNCKHLLKPGGVIIITVPSIGCGFHGYPEDHWRFEQGDIKTIFSDFDIEELWRSPESEGVFLKARRPQRLIEYDTSRYKLYSIMKGRRTLKNRG